MNGFLLDTNVVSETAKQHPQPAVIEFMNMHSNLWLPVVVIHELAYGIMILDEGRRRDMMATWLSQIVSDFSGHILPVDRQAAEIAASMRAHVHRDGGRLKIADALIAGTAMANDMAVATRNVRDFDGLGVDVVNPWEES